MYSNFKLGKSNASFPKKELAIVASFQRGQYEKKHY